MLLLEFETASTKDASNSSSSSSLLALFGYKAVLVHPICCAVFVSGFP